MEDEPQSQNQLTSKQVKDAIALLPEDMQNKLKVRMQESTSKIKSFPTAVDELTPEELALILEKLRELHPDKFNYGDFAWFLLKLGIFIDILTTKEEDQLLRQLGFLPYKVPADHKNDTRSYYKTMRLTANEDEVLTKPQFGSATPIPPMW